VVARDKLGRGIGEEVARDAGVWGANWWAALAVAWLAWLTAVLAAAVLGLAAVVFLIGHVIGLDSVPRWAALAAGVDGAAGVIGMVRCIVWYWARQRRGKPGSELLYRAGLRGFAAAAACAMALIVGSLWA